MSLISLSYLFYVAKEEDPCLIPSMEGKFGEVPTYCPLVAVECSFVDDGIISSYYTAMISRAAREQKRFPPFLYLCLLSCILWFRSFSLPSEFYYEFHFALFIYLMIALTCTRDMYVRQIRFSFSSPMFCVLLLTQQQSFVWWWDVFDKWESNK